MKLWLFVIPLVLVACAFDPIPEVSTEMANEFEVDQRKLEYGRELYIQNCNRCHARVLPGKLDAEYWRKIVPHMAQNAKLKKGDDQAILLYLMAAHNEVHGIH